MLSELGATARRLASAQRVAQFTVVGITGAIIDMAVLVVLYGWVGLPLLEAKVWAAEAGIVVAFALNEVWTFGEEGVAGLRATAKRFLASNAVRVVGIAIAAGVLVALKTWFGVWYLVANAAGLGVGGVVNYTFESLFAWQIHR